MICGENIAKAKGGIADDGEIEVIQHRINAITGEPADVKKLVTDAKHACKDNYSGEMRHKQDQHGQHNTIERFQRCCHVNGPEVAGSPIWA